MTFALYTFKLTKTVYNYGPESEIKKKKFIYSDFTVQSTKWWQGIISEPRKANSGVKAVLR